MMRRPLLGLLAVICLSTAAAAENHWPRFRGPNADGVAPDNTELPTTWTNTENVKWVAEVPGWGWSCPVVWDDRVFLTSVVSEEENLTPSKGLYLGQGVREPAKGVHHWMVYCFDLNTGKEIWKHEAHSGQPQVPRHPKSTYASETPTTDGERLYVLFGDLGLYCYGLDGKPLWSQKIEPKKTFFDYGAAASPVVHDGQVIVVYDNLEDSWIAAFDAKTGDQRWRQARDETHSWATPLIWRNDLRTEIVVPGKNRNRSYSLDGELLWQFDGKMSNLVIPSPFAAHGMCYIASGYVGDRHRPTFALRPGASGEIAAGDDFSDSDYIAWYQGKSSPYNPSQIVYGDYLYTLFDRGFLTCHDATTGEEVYGKHRFSPSGSFTASPFAYNGHLFLLSEDGLTYVVKAGSEFEIVARNELDEFCIASPAIVGDKLLIRTASKLYCLTEGAKLDAATAARLQPRKTASSAADIWSAAAEGDLERITQLLEKGVSVNARQPGSGSTPLNTAAVFGQTAVAKLLIKKGADVSITNPDGNSALLIASFFAHTEFVQLLLEKGAPINVKNRRGETPLDTVSANWSPQLEETYRSIGDMIGIELDLERINQTRPKIAELLREKAEKDSNKRSDASLPPNPSTGAWQALPDMAVPRWEAGSVVFEDRLYVFGGYKMPTRACKRADVFDPKDNSWRQLADLPSAVTHMNLVLDGRSIWFAGGFKDGYKGYALSEVWRYDIDENTFVEGPSLPAPRASGGLAIVGRKLHFVGGLTKDRDTCSAKHWVLDLEEVDRGNAKWQEAKPMSKGRCHFGTATFNEKIYLIGGMYHHDSQQIDLPLVDIYDPETDSWSKGGDLPTGHTHAEASTFVHNNQIYFLGGMAQVGERRWIDNKITTLTPEGSWKHVGELPRPLSASAAGIVAGKLYLAGGSLNGATPQPGMWVRSAP